MGAPPSLVGNRPDHSARTIRSTLSPYYFPIPTFDMCRRRWAVKQKIAQARQTIHELTIAYEIALAKQFAWIAQFHRELNTLTPIGKLPPELLVKIFGLCTPQAELEQLPIQNSYGWTAITRVCHRWRIVAMEASELWTMIAADKVSGVKGFSMLSRNRLLTVQSSVTTDEAIAPLRTLLRLHPHRVETLWLSANHTVHNIALERVSAPYLKALSLTNKDSFGPIPQFISNLSAPSLENLILSGWWVCWKSAIFRCTITKLIIFGETIRRWTTPMGQDVWEEMLDALERMPKLEILDITNLLPSRLPESMRVVKLPHLQRIRLSDAISPCMQLLSSLLYPSNTFIVLKLGYPPVPYENDLARTFSLPQNIASTAIIFAQDQSEATLRGFSRVLPARQLAGNTIEPRIHATFSPLTEDNSSYAIAWFSSLLSSSRVESAFFGDILDTPANQAEIIDLSKSLSDVTQLCVRGTSCARLLPGLLKPQSSLIPLPRLRNLSLTNVDIQRMSRRFETLQDVLRCRQQLIMDAPLEKGWNVAKDGPISKRLVKLFHFR
ncbi:hypothetical protein NLI96_g5285 [Meripilus lineatus]|uniref:F-box domain-containing protein n=1 Tax=Meripilus lineatus TaxID=2056292 RepID=A0AAD5V558_9APHY|nr:hypothetical protein NLI96_g5285 [Physisporinus lineatus]